MAKTDNVDLNEIISNKLNVLIALSLKNLIEDSDFSKQRKRSRIGTGDLVKYFADHGLSPKDISAITDTSVQSVRTLLTPKRRKA